MLHGMPLSNLNFATHSAGLQFASLIDLEGIGMIVIAASLRSDFTHIAGIRNQENFCFVSNK
jgi:hypothetical protein